MLGGGLYGVSRNMMAIYGPPNECAQAETLMKEGDKLMADAKTQADTAKTAEIETQAKEKLIASGTSQKSCADRLAALRMYSILTGAVAGIGVLLMLIGAFWPKKNANAPTV
jgi:hypothetical protein